MVVDVCDAASRIDVERKQFKINQSGGNGRGRAIMSCCRVCVSRTDGNLFSADGSATVDRNRCLNKVHISHLMTENIKSFLCLS